MRKLAIGRTVGLVIAVLALGAAASLWWESRRLDRAFVEWIDARPMEATVDLSQPGEITVPFHQTCQISHGESIYLESRAGDNRDLPPEEVCKGMAGSMVVVDAEGNEVGSATIDGADASRWGDKDDICIGRFLPFHEGDYVATVQIDSGAAALAGEPRRVYAAYDLCGMERMPAFIVGVFAAGAGVIGLVASVCVLPGLVRHGVWRAAPTRDS